MYTFEILVALFFKHSVFKIIFSIKIKASLEKTILFLLTFCTIVFSYKLLNIYFTVSHIKLF